MRHILGHIDFAMLNQAQQQAVLQQGNLLIIAGPGTGKTHTLSHKIAYTLKDLRVAAENVIALTFTTKAAHELEKRIQKLLPDFPLPFCGTFHAWCLQLLKKYGASTGLTSPVILSAQQQFELFSNVCLKANPFLKKKEINQYFRRLGLAKNQLQSVPTDDFAALVFANYEQTLAEHRALDFDDVILKTIMMLKNSAEIRIQVSEQLHYLFIDEYQDINEAQFELIRAALGPRTTLCAIGDPDQAIYAFRGSNVSHFLRFEQDFPAPTLIHLEENYRSTQNILAAANTLIQHNTERLPKNIAATKERGEVIQQYVFDNPWKEADFIVQKIQRLSGGIDMVQTDNFSHDADNSFHFSDIAILFRTKERGRILEESLKKSGIPYQLVTKKAWYSKPEIQIIFSFLRLLFNTQDDLSLVDVLMKFPCNLSKKNIERIYEYAQKQNISLWETLQEQHLVTVFSSSVKGRLLGFRDTFLRISGQLNELTPAQCIQHLLNKFELEAYFRNGRQGEKKHQNILMLLTASAQFDAFLGKDGIGQLLEYFSLLEQEHSYDAHLQAVSLMTLHAAKGLEFPVVFVIGLEDSVLPLQKNDDSDGSLEEERRLLYVGITRAKEKLYISRVKFWKEETYLPSPFLQEIEHLLEKKEIASKKRKIKEENQLSLW